MEYKADNEKNHVDHGPVFKDDAGHTFTEHSYIPPQVFHIPKPKTHENATHFEDALGEMAHLMALVGIFIYTYTLVGCYIFEPCFIRQLAFALQTILMFMMFTSLMPCVLKWQTFLLFPNITSWEFPFVIVTLLAANLLLAKGSEQLLFLIMDKYKNKDLGFNDRCRPCGNQDNPCISYNPSMMRKKRRQCRVCR